MTPELTPDAAARLDAAWQPARRSGALGPASVEELRAHSAGFIEALQRRFTAEFTGSGLDLGTGAGVPGVFCSWGLPRWRWVLVDASLQRCGFAEAAVDALGLGDRVSVRHGRADEPASSELGGPFDAVTARLFGPAAETLEVGLSLARTGGALVASVRAADRSWWETLPQRVAGVPAVDVIDSGDAVYATVVRGSDWDPALPRRAAARRRKPLA